jgi:hypothetical protein
MVRKRSDVGAVNSEVSHLEISIYPFRDTTQAAVVLVRGHGNRAVRLRLWAGYLDCSRGDLSGLDAGQSTVLLCRHLQRVLDTAGDGEQEPVGPGVPLGGPQGGAHPETAPPGLGLPL